MIKKLKQLFCNHDYIDIDKNELPKIPSGKNGQYRYVRLHKCIKCDKQKDVWSDWLSF